MNLERQLAVRELIEVRARELGSIMNASQDTTAPPEELLTALVKLTDLRNELEFLRGDSTDSDAPEAYVMVPLRPAPHLNSGSIARPEPDSEDF